MATFALLVIVHVVALNWQAVTGGRQALVGLPRFTGLWTALAGAALALIIAAIYMLRAVRNILHGPLPDRWASVPDATPWRKLPFVLLLAALIAFGVFPRGLTERIQPSVQAIINAAAPPVETVSR